MVDGDLSPSVVAATTMVTATSGAGLALTILVAAALLLPWLPAFLPRRGPPKELGRRNSRCVEPTHASGAAAIVVDDDDTATTPASDRIAQPDPGPSVPSPGSSWRCACEGGSFLPPGLLAQSLGGAHAVLRMGTGQCYHKSSGGG